MLEKQKVYTTLTNSIKVVGNDMDGLLVST